MLALQGNNAEAQREKEWEGRRGIQREGEEGETEQERDTNANADTCGVMRRQELARRSSCKSFAKLVAKSVATLASPSPPYLLSLAHATVSSLILRHETEACSLFPVSKRSLVVPPSLASFSPSFLPTRPETGAAMSRLWIVLSGCICIAVLVFVSRTWIMARILSASCCCCCCCCCLLISKGRRETFQVRKICANGTR